MRSRTRPYPAQPRRRSRRKGGTIAIVAVVAAFAYGTSLDEDTQTVVDAMPAQTTAQESASQAGQTPEPATAPPTTSAPEPEAQPTTPAPAEPAAVEAEPAVAEAEPTVVAAPGTALAAVADLEVKGRAPQTGYDRDLFRYRSYDLDRNGCDARNDILRRDLDDLVIKHGTQGCVVLSGRLISPYSGELVEFVRDSGGGAIEIDHVVSLSDAWQKGAQAWDEDTLRTFGNDPLNLLAVEGRLNSQKGAGDTATWLPPDTGYRCGFVARQVAVKLDYGLWVTPAEQEAMVRVLTSCPDEPLPEAEYAELRPELAAAPAAPSPEPATAAPPATVPAPIMAQEPGPEPAPADPAGDTDPRHKTCKAAKAAGLGPYHQGSDPEYDWYRDADQDGIVCE